VGGLEQDVLQGVVLDHKPERQVAGHDLGPLLTREGAALVKALDQEQQLFGGGGGG
jgi:hypothetical protein